MNWKHSILLLAIAVGGCATAAQRQAQAIRINTQAVADQLKICTSAVYNSPEFTSLRAHTPLDIRDATIQQMTDSSMASDEEIQAIYVTHPLYQACRKSALDRLSTVTPTLVPILADGWARQESALIDLVQKKATWGDVIRRAKDISADTRNRLTAASQQINAGLERSHEAEMARRQQAFQAMQQYYQNQQLINAINRPVITSCSAFGNMAQCVSQ